MIKDLKKEITRIINILNIENLSDTPDFILAEYLVACLKAYNQTIKARNKFYSNEENIDKNLPQLEREK